MKKILIRTLLVFLLICVLGTLVLSLPFVQTRLAQYATNSINKEFGTQINIDRLRVSLISWDTSLKGVYVEDYQKDTLFYIRQLSTSIMSVSNLIDGNLEFGDIDVDELIFNMHTYRDTTASNLEIFIDKLDDGKPRAPGTPPFLFTSSRINIKEGKFKLIDDHLEKPKILDFKNLNIEAPDFMILGPEVTSRIEFLAFDSNRGIIVEDFKTDFKYTKQQMRFDSLTIKTPASQVHGNIVFNYDRKDFSDFLNRVNIDAEFNESIVAFDEINLCTTNLGKARKWPFRPN